MSHKPDFSPDSSGPYLKPRLIPKRAPAADEDNTPRATASRSHLWFEDSVVVPDEFRKLLVEYSHIPAEKIDEHVVQVVSLWPITPFGFE